MAKMRTVSTLAPLVGRLHWPLKRALDICGALTGLILLSPIFFIIAVLIRLDSPGPILYLRRVVGLNGKEFNALKFRTMVVNAEEMLRHNPDLLSEFEKNFKLRDDPRVTRIGRFLRKTTLDESPQVLNVLRGEMSLVGPRMITRAELGKYAEHAETLLSVKPGMAGPWVAAGRQEIPYEYRVGMNLDYIRNWSLWLDIKILVRSAIAVVAMRGAY